MLRTIQAQLESIYGLRCSHAVSDFLIDEAEAGEVLSRRPEATEELLVVEHDGELEVGLCLAPELRGRIEAPGLTLEQLLYEDLPSLCTAAEGVSHFLYLLHCAELDRRVTLLELEAQAEVDKFALCMLLAWKSEGRFAFRHYFGRLFDRFRLVEALNAPERWRYEEATRLARSFCQRLLPVVGRGHRDQLLAELRHAYRLGAEAKLAYFSRAA